MKSTKFKIIGTIVLLAVLALLYFATSPSGTVSDEAETQEQAQ